MGRNWPLIGKQENHKTDLKKQQKKKKPNCSTAVVAVVAAAVVEAHVMQPHQSGVSMES